MSASRQTLLKEAADWLVRLDAGALSDSEQQALNRWCQASPEHTKIWQAACQLNQQLAAVPGALARPVLGRQRVDRRAVLKSIAAVSVLGPAAWTLSRSSTWQPWLAEHRTFAGGRRVLTLDDTSELTLNTDTAFDVLFDQHQRIIRLHQGEVFVRTGDDPARRPFYVHTAQGGIQALGTEFAVRCLPDITQVSVVKSAVRVAPMSGITPILLEQGQQCRFSASAIESIQNIKPDSLAWRHGEIIVENVRLGTFIAELARYRPGILHCTPEVASLHVSGVFQTANTEQALEVLEQVLDLKITRYTDYWVSVGRA